MKIKIIYEDKDLLVIDKPARIVVFSEGKNKGKTVIDLLLAKKAGLKRIGRPPRYGTVHRLDKDTSGILLVAKNNETLDFLQRQFKNREVIKKYSALVVGNLKADRGTIETLIGRSPKNRKKQKVYLPYEPKAGKKRTAITEYRVLERFSAKGGSASRGKDYTLLEIRPKTGRKHQIRTHLAYLGYPIAGDKIYGFKNQICPKGLERQFLHASDLEIIMPDKKRRGFQSPLPKELKEALNSFTKKTLSSS